jgi:hypothetical protein
MRDGTAHGLRSACTARVAPGGACKELGLTGSADLEGCGPSTGPVLSALIALQASRLGGYPTGSLGATWLGIGRATRPLECAVVKSRLWETLRIGGGHWINWQTHRKRVKLNTVPDIAGLPMGKRFPRQGRQLLRPWAGPVRARRGLSGQVVTLLSLPRRIPLRPPSLARKMPTHRWPADVIRPAGPGGGVGSVTSSIGRAFLADDDRGLSPAGPAAVRVLPAFDDTAMLPSSWI